MIKRQQSVKAWLKKAGNDWLNVQNNLAAAIVPWDTVCFHAQQTIEKMLKALLIAQGYAPPKSHDLLLILDTNPGESLAMKKWRADCRLLGEFAVSVRYPDGCAPTARQARRLVARAARVREAIGKRLKAVSVRPAKSQKNIVRSMKKERAL